jgi:hypothetical protein
MDTATKNKPGVNSKPPDTKKIDPKATQANPFAVPPDEQFWQRYSPHYEAPISFVSSWFFHFIVIGIFGGLGILAAMLGWNRAQNIEFGAVHIPGGGGGNENGVGDAPGIGSGATEDVNNVNKDPDPLPFADRPPLDATQVQMAKQVFNNEDAVRYINSNNENIDKMMKNLNKDMLNKLRDGITPGRGKDGTGSGGGSGTGTGTGTGSGIGSGDNGKISDREKRMLRWSMIFETQNPNDYVSQLAGLGAILAIPTGGSDEYRVIHDLKQKPPVLQVEDVSKLNRIYWIDDKPQSVNGVMSVLGLPRVSHFVAFMPQELEIKLFDKEKAAAQGMAEDQIGETKFKVIHTGSGYDVQVKSLTRKN